VVTQDEEEKDAPEHLDPRQVREEALAEDQNFPRWAFSGPCIGKLEWMRGQRVPP
jgi:hypothetical protein